MPSTRAQSSKEGGAQTKPRSSDRDSTPSQSELSNTKKAEEEQIEGLKEGKGVDASVPQKRKDSESDEPATSPPPAKAARTSSPAKDSSSPSKGPTPTQLLRYLLSSESLSLTAPESEVAAAEEGSRIYATAQLTAFEELLAAVVLSRPISHKLGQRTIRTLFNDPYNLTTPGAIRDAGHAKVLQALWDARTQHKDKTTDEVVGLADAVVEMWAESEDDGSLEKCREDTGYDVRKEREWLKKSVKGLGETGLDIFCRRVQWLWDEVYPFVDRRTSNALRELGLPEQAGELKDLLESEWEGLGVADLGVDQEERRIKRAFVLLLERAIGASLEKHVQDIINKVAG